VIRVSFGNFMIRFLANKPSRVREQSSLANRKLLSGPERQGSI